jgi:hypothetical protein
VRAPGRHSSDRKVASGSRATQKQPLDFLVISGQFAAVGARPYIYKSSLHAPVAQLDRAPGYEPGGREFESLRARQFQRLTALAVHRALRSDQGVTAVTVCKASGLCSWTEPRELFQPLRASSAPSGNAGRSYLTKSSITSVRASSSAKPMARARAESKRFGQRLTMH